MQVKTIAANEITFFQSGLGTDVGAAKEIRIFTGDYIRNGTELHSYTIERQFLEHAPVTYEYFNGMAVDTAAINVEAQSQITASFGLKGTTAQMQDSGRIAGATDVDSPNFDILTSSCNVGTIRENGVAVAAPNYVLGFTLEIANNLRARPAVGFKTSIGHGVGDFAVTGTINTYFGNKALATKSN